MNDYSRFDFMHLGHEKEAFVHLLCINGLKCFSVYSSIQLMIIRLYILLLHMHYCDVLKEPEL